jgi:hypothetical protein
MSLIYVERWVDVQLLEDMISTVCSIEGCYGEQVFENHMLLSIKIVI